VSLLDTNEEFKSFGIFPAYCREVMDSLIARDWLIHSFPLDIIEVHNPSNYLLNSHITNTKYECFLDANVFQFVVNAAKKKNAKNEQRDAIALVIFCQLAEINIEPALACYERINHLKENADEAVNEIELFRKIDNTDSNELAKFALGYTNVLAINEEVPTDKETLKAKLLEHERLKDWDSMYLMVLKIVCVRFLENGSSHQKTCSFVDWCLSDFRLSIVAIMYSVIAFGKKPTKRMMKFALNMSACEKRLAI
jgi:hypothetical protein